MQMWDYVLLEGPEPQSSNISKQLLQTMRREFNYWYPYDLRVSSDMHISSCNTRTLLCSDVTCDYKALAGMHVTSLLVVQKWQD